MVSTNQNPEAVFNQNFEAIQAAKQQTGDWEKAYQQVTGTPWPKGQHIKLGGDGAHMEKDRSKLGTIAKIASIAAPIAATVFTGGAASPWLMAALGGGTGALGGAADGGGWMGALKGGAIGAGTGFAGAKIGNMVKGLGASNAINPATGAKMGGTTIADILKNPAAANIGLGGSATGNSNLITSLAGNGGGGNWWDKIVGGAKKVIGSGGKGNTDENGGDQKWGDAATVMDDFSKGELIRRLMKGEMTQNYDKLNFEAAEQNRTQESDAMKKLAQTSYLMNGGAKPLPTQVNSGHLTDFGFAPAPASDAQKQGASTLQGTLLKRLTPEGALAPTKPDYLNEGTAEKVGKWGGVITGGIGAAKNIFGW